jgi:4-oxalocrotonate tautomerase
MPEVYVHLIEGRSIEQKRALVAEITAAVVKHAAVPAEAVMVEILDVPRHNKAKAGVLFSDRK